MNGHKIRLSKSSISTREKDAVLAVLNEEMLGMGIYVHLFEKNIKKYIGTKKDVVCVNTGTSALHIALTALGLGIGDEVLVPSLTYVATFQAISATGATPVACEVNPETLFLDIDDVRSRINARTKVILPVHYASNSYGIDAVYSLANEFGLRVVEDAAQSFGCFQKKQKIGVSGDILCFSFDGIKNITSGEGGAVLSDDKNFIDSVKDIRLLGVEKDTEKRFLDERSWDFSVSKQGFRYHMSNIMAAIGIAQLERIEEFREKRQKIARKYVEGLKDINFVKTLKFNFDEVLPHIFVIKAQKRDKLREHLISNNIECGVHYKPNHLLDKFRTPYQLIKTEQLYREILTLPCHFDLTDTEQKEVIDKIKEFYNA